jgi:hypothetical protein
VDGNTAAKKRFGLIGVPKIPQVVRKIDEAQASLVMLGAQHLLADRQRALLQRPGAGKVALAQQQAANIVEGGRRTGMLNAVDFELDARTAAILALKKRARPLPDEEISVKAEWLREAERTLAEKDVEIANLKRNSTSAPATPTASASRPWRCGFRSTTSRIRWVI